VGDALFIAASAAAARTTLGSGTGGDAVFVTASVAAARTALGSTTVGDAVFVAASAAAARTALALGDVSTQTVADAAAVRAATATRTIDTTAITNSLAEVGLTDAATITVTPTSFINANVTLAGNRTLGQPASTLVGRSGYIRIIQDGTGSRTLAFHVDWKFPGGVDPTLSTAAGAIDVLYYQCISANFWYANLVKDVK
jgi:hypothetical protein